MTLTQLVGSIGKVYGTSIPSEQGTVNTVVHTLLELSAVKNTINK